MSVKRCKGTGKAKGFGCGAELCFSVASNGLKTYQAKYGLGLACKCWNNFLINSDAGQIILKQTTLKVTKSRRELEALEKQTKAERSLNSLKLYVRDTVHRYIRQRDKGKKCISCSASWHKSFQAGHFYKAELYSSLKFDFNNIHGQCVRCNIRDEGNPDGYRFGLIQRFGHDYVKILDDKASEYKKHGFKWSKDKLIEIRETAKDKMKQL